jgi:hypothetical protein
MLPVPLRMETMAAKRPSSMGRVREVTRYFPTLRAVGIIVFLDRGHNVEWPA